MEQEHRKFKRAVDQTLRSDDVGGSARAGHQRRMTGGGAPPNGSGHMEWNLAAPRQRPNPCWGDKAPTRLAMSVSRPDPPRWICSAGADAGTASCCCCRCRGPSISAPRASSACVFQDQGIEELAGILRAYAA